MPDLTQSDPMSRYSQVTIIGEPQPKTWDDYERGCLATYGGGHCGECFEAFQHGMSTVFNLLRDEFPPAELCTLLPRLLAEVQQLRGSDATVVELEADLDVARKKIAALLAERREREAKLAEWRPISEAPKDRNAILVWCPEYQNTFCVYWLDTGEDTGHWRFFGGGGDKLYDEPTHFQPLPPAPNTKGTE